MNRRSQCLILGLLVFYGVLFVSMKTVAVMSSIGQWGTVIIAAHSECYQVTNTCGPTVMIPYRTLAEWNTVKASAPGCISRVDLGYSYCYGGMGMGQDGQDGAGN